MFQYQPPQTPWLSVLYQDNDILVLNKQAGLLTVPGKAPEHFDSVIWRVQRALPTARIVHRLDMATSGLLLLALHKPAQGHLGKQFEQRQVHKRYEAVVSGELENSEGEVNLPLRCDWPNRPKQMVDPLEGKSAQTFYKVLERRPGATHVELTPITGRSHQLRVHMLALGHPIQGDRLYGQPHAVTQAPRLQLHATTLAFEHPSSGEAMRFHCPANFS
ncbi:RNA pseudouridine synthase [Aliidiomarina taiwanensis]|uniref:Pseudouridine synthase n=1 Tax=Aliidiomarina taiwanensis TaxID=946228 RepID=A0A432X1M5_9GAMM|nr:RluA family pseudouridine synthase [Aliidiomarina taiwanensis]RUO40071.1 RNA pseudouridine synthase [Aliidiomarina taiwanensis]